MEKIDERSSCMYNVTKHDMTLVSQQFTYVMYNTNSSHIYILVQDECRSRADLSLAKSFDSIELRGESQTSDITVVSQTIDNARVVIYLSGV